MSAMPPASSSNLQAVACSTSAPAPASNPASSSASNKTPKPSSTSEKPKRRESQENRWRRNRYHLVASNHRLPSDPDEESDYLFSVLANPRKASLYQRSASSRSGGGSSPRGRGQQQYQMTLEETELHETKLDLLRELAKSGGDPTTPVFRDTLSQLTALYGLGNWDAREDPALSRSYHGDDGSTPPSDPNDASGPALEGTWLTLSRPSFPGCRGRNSHGEFVYTLGQMSFDMFRPTELVCSIQGTFNKVEVVRDEEVRRSMEDLPKALRAEVKRGESILRTYTIITAFTIEPSTFNKDPHSPNEAISTPIKGVMTTTGYILPDPDRPHRLSVWFDGGQIEVNDDFDLDEWRGILGDANGSGSLKKGDSSKKGGASKKAGAKRRISGRAKIFAARMLMGASPPEDTGGMEEDGTVRYRLRRPIGGHGKSYVDVMYLDGSMRVMRGNMGSVYVFVRVPEA